MHISVLNFLLLPFSTWRELGLIFIAMVFAPAPVTEICSESREAIRINLGILPTARRFLLRREVFAT